MKNKLVYNNNWEYDTYLVNNMKVDTLTKVSINNKEYDVISRKVSIPYNDMGHTYEATSVHYFVKESAFAIEQMFDLNKIVPKVTVIAVEFTLKEEQ